MHELAEAIANIVRKDRRYPLDAYYFVFESLAYAHKIMGLGAAQRDRSDRDIPAGDFPPGDPPPEVERHLTGQELCEAIRQFALEQYGYMAKCVLNSWGVRSTGDFGEIVFNLIRAGHMKKTPLDRREDFDDNFDFDAGLVQSFQITMSP
jgi:uncharacterized repeat protein (TIGR04138 family)